MIIKLKRNIWKQIEKFKQVDTDFSSHQREWEEFEQIDTLIVLDVLFVLYNSEEIKLAYKLRYNYKRKKHVILLMINDEPKNSYYFVVKNLSELDFLVWWRGRKEAIINGDNSFQNARNDALNYRTIETHPERISKIKAYIDKYIWEGIEFPAGPKDWKKVGQNNKKIALNILLVPRNTETIRVAYRSEYNHKLKNQVNLLMITNGTKWHYFAITNMKKYVIITTAVVYKCQNVF